MTRRGQWLKGRSPVRRFLMKVALPTTEDGCLRWTGCVTNKGYGQFYVSRERRTSPHRFSYEYFVGAIPPGLELDHLCRVPNCVRPDHLEAVTRQVNQRRGFGFAGVHARKTHCPRGHEYTPENTRLRERKPGRFLRDCKECHRLRKRKPRSIETSEVQA